MAETLNEWKDMAIALTVLTSLAGAVIWLLIRDRVIKLVKKEVEAMESRVMETLDRWRKSDKELDAEREKRAKEDRDKYRESFENMTERIDRLMEKRGS